MPAWQASAARHSRIASAAPERLAQAHVQRRATAAARAAQQAAVAPARPIGAPAWQWSSASGRQRVQHRRGSAGDEAVEQHRERGTRAPRAMAPAMAAISRPPSRRSTSSGSPSARRWRASARLDHGRLERHAVAVQAGARAGPVTPPRRRTGPRTAPRPRWCCRCPSRPAPPGRDPAAARHAAIERVEALGLAHRRGSTQKSAGRALEVERHAP